MHYAEGYGWIAAVREPQLPNKNNHAMHHLFGALRFSHWSRHAHPWRSPLSFTENTFLLTLLVMTAHRIGSPYRPGSPGGRPQSSSSLHTKVEEELHEMAGIDYDKVNVHTKIPSVKERERESSRSHFVPCAETGDHQAQSFGTGALRRSLDTRSWHCNLIGWCTLLLLWQKDRKKS